MLMREWYSVGSNRINSQEKSKNELWYNPWEGKAILPYLLNVTVILHN